MQQQHSSRHSTKALEGETQKVVETKRTTSSNLEHLDKQGTVWGRGTIGESRGDKYETFSLEPIP